MQFVLIVLEEVQVATCAVVAESVHPDYFLLRSPQSLLARFPRVVRTLVLVLVSLSLLFAWRALLEWVVEGTSGVFFGQFGCLNLVLFFP